MKLWISITALLCITALAAQPVQFYEANDLETYQKALNKALEKEQMIFVALHREDGFAKMHRNGVFQDRALADALKNYLPLAIKVYGEMGSRWIELFPAKEIPAFYFLDQEELVLVRLWGYQDPEDLIKAARRAEKYSTRYDSIRSLTGNEQLSQKQMAFFLDIHELNFPFVKTQKVAQEYFNGLNREQLFEKPIGPYLVRYGVDLETEYPYVVLKNAKKLSENLEDFEPQTFYESTYAFNFDRIVISEDSVLLQELTEKYVPLAPDTSLSVTEMQYRSYRSFGQETEMFHFYLKGAEKYNPYSTTEKKANWLFDEAYKLAEDFNTDESQKVSRELARKAFALKQEFQYKMLEAYMSYLLEEYSTALQNIEDAAALTDEPNQLQRADNLRTMVKGEMEK